MLFKVYPNPSHGKFTINAGENGKEIVGASLEVFNTLGTKVYSTPTLSLQNALEIDLTGLPAGVYSIRVYHKRNIYTEKIVLDLY